MLVDDFPGANPTGTTRSDTAVAAAIKAMGSNPGILEFATPGPYELAGNYALSANQGIKGQGVTTINYTGTGTLFDMHGASSTNPPAAGPVRGIHILGFGAGAGSCGLQTGDLYMTRIDDLWIQGFTQKGSVGLWFNNLLAWSERARVDAVVDNCATCVLFDNHLPSGPTSYDYSIYDLSVVCDANQNGVVVRNDTMLYGVRFTLLGNFLAGQVNTGAVLDIGPGVGDYSYILGAGQIGCETSETGIGHADINVGASARLDLDGCADFGAFGVPFTVGSASKSNTTITGRTNLPRLSAIRPS